MSNGQNIEKKTTHSRAFVADPGPIMSAMVHSSRRYAVASADIFTVMAATGQMLHDCRKEHLSRFRSRLKVSHWRQLTVVYRVVAGGTGGHVHTVM